MNATTGITAMMRLFAALLIIALLSDAALAEDAKSVFDSLFAAKIKSVSATVDRADDIALAKELLALAKTSANQPALVALLCDAAHDLGARHADGYAAAAEAMTLLADTVEEKRPAARDKLITLLTRQSAAGKPDEREAAGEALIDLLITLGDEKAEKKQYAEAIADFRRAVAVATQKKSASLEDAKAKLESTQSRDRTMKNLARLQEKLLKDANDSATAEEIVKLYVVELDDPESAKAYLNRVKDEQIKSLVPLAAGAVDQVSEESALKLGEWYKSMARDPKSPLSAIVFRRAKVYLARYLEVHTTSDLSRTKAEVMAKEVDAALTLTPTAPAIAKPTPVHLAKLMNEAVLVVTFDSRTISKAGSSLAIRDLSKSKSEGIVTAAELTKGMIGEALQFKAGNSCVQFDGKWEFPAGVTITCWVKFDDFDIGYPYLFSGENNHLALHGLGTEYAEQDRGRMTLHAAREGALGVRSTKRIKPGEWTFVAASYDGKSLRVSVNNSEADSRDPGKILKIPTMKYLRLGNSRLNGEDSLHGALDELAVFPRALTADEIKSIYEAGKKGQSLK